VAEAGHRKALDALFKCLAIPSVSIRRAAVVAIAAPKERARREANLCLDNAFAPHPGFTIA
jgi:hypothetical protein